MTRRTWWWGFGLLIGLPAATLALLGLQAVRASDIEQVRRLQDEQRQVASLVDAALGVALTRVIADVDTEIEASGRAASVRSAVDEGVVSFVQDGNGVMAFPRHRVFFGSPDRLPQASDWQPPSPDVLALIDEAQTLEAQERGTEARAAYDRVGRADPSLSEWVTLRLLVDRAAAGDAIAISELANDRRAESTSRSPAGAPVAVVASTMSAVIPASARGRFRPLVMRTLQELRSGRWWLSRDQRGAYDAELRALLAKSGGLPVPGDDARLTEVDALDHRLRLLQQGGEGAGIGSYDRTTWLPGAGPPALLVWSGGNPATGQRRGAVLTGARPRQFVETVVGPIVAGRAFDAALVDRNGIPLWGAARVSSWQSIPLEAAPGWRITFTPPSPQPGRRVLRYATGILPAVVLVTGLLMTVVIVRRELALARLQSTFLASVTHELKSPITSIRLLIERLDSGRLAAGDSPSRYYAAVDAEATRLESLVNRLLESQKLQIGERVYRFETISMPALIRHVVERWRPQADAKGIRVDLSTPEVLDMSVDRDAIADLVGNLIDNAIKYSPTETTVVVTLRRAGQRMDLDVADEGAGVDRADWERIFDPFYRGQRGDREDVHGTGLGLWLAKSSALAHGGSIRVRPNGERGSRFTVSLPVERPVAADASATTLLVPTASAPLAPDQRSSGGDLM